MQAYDIISNLQAHSQPTNTYLSQVDKHTQNDRWIAWQASQPQMPSNTMQSVQHEMPPANQRFEPEPMTQPQTMRTAPMPATPPRQQPPRTGLLKEIHARHNRVTPINYQT